MTWQNQHTGLIFSVRERFLRSWINNLMVFKTSGLGLEKIGGLDLNGLATSLHLTYRTFV